MARGANFYHDNSDLGLALGQTLGRALFGDPEAAAQLALRKSQMGAYEAQAASDNAHAGLYGSQDADQQLRTKYRQQFGPLGDTILQMSGIGTQPAVPATAVAAPTGAAPAEQAAPAPSFSGPGFQRSIVPLIMSLAGAQENPNIGDTVGAVSAMLGPDEFARRGMVAQGVTPTKDFALTTDRADAIAKQGYDADYRKDTAVANINNRDDIPVAKIQAGASRDVATINNRDDIPVANIQAGASRDVARINNQIGFTLVSDVLPGAQMSGGERSPKRNAEVGGVSDSYHLPNDGVEAYDITPMSGVSFAQAKAKMQAKYGGRLVEAIDETNRPGHGPHWHFAIATPPGAKATKEKAPPQVSAADSKAVTDEIDTQLKSRGWAAEGKAKDNIRISAMKNYQQSGNPAQAVADALGVVERRMKQGGKPAAQAAAAPAKPAPKAAGTNVAQERKMALTTVAQTKDPKAVAAIRARFKQRTGQEL